MESFDGKTSKKLTDTTIPKEQSFSIKLSFTKGMDISKNPKNFIGLVNKEGQSLPLHIIPSQDNKTFTIRSKNNLAMEDSVHLYILPGMTDIDGGNMIDSYNMKLNLPLD